MIYYYHRHQNRPEKSSSNPQLPKNNPPGGDYQPREYTMPQSSSDEEKMRKGKEEPAAEQSEKGSNDSPKPESVIELPGTVDADGTEEGLAQNETESFPEEGTVSEADEAPVIPSEPQKEVNEINASEENQPKKRARGVGASMLDSIHESEMKDHSASEDHPESSNQNDKKNSTES